MVDRPVYVCRFADKEPPLEGELCGTVWDRAEVFESAFHLVGTVSDRSRSYLSARALWDDDALHVAFESDPSPVPVTKRRRGPPAARGRGPPHRRRRGRIELTRPQDTRRGTRWSNFVPDHSNFAWVRRFAPGLIRLIDICSAPLAHFRCVHRFRQFAHKETHFLFLRLGHETRALVILPQNPRNPAFFHHDLK